MKTPISTSSAKPLFRLPKNVYLLGFFSFFNDLTSDMIGPLLPVFLASMGYGAEFLGLMEGVANALSNITKLLAGWKADQLGRSKNITIFGYALCAFIRPLFAIAHPFFTFTARVVDRLGKGIRTAPRDHLLTAHLDRKYWGRAFGLQRTMDHAGSFLAPLLATLLLTIFSLKLSHLFLIASIPSILAVLFLSKRLTEAPAPLEKKFEKLSWKTLPRPLKYYVGVIFLAALSTPSELFLILKLQETGLHISYTPLVWLTFTAFAMLAAFAGGYLADRWKVTSTIALGWSLFALCYLGFAFSYSLMGCWILVAIFGFQNGLVEAGERSLPATIVSSHKRATALGWYYFAYGLGGLPASLLFGILWKMYGSQVSFIVYAFLTLLSVGLILKLPITNASEKKPEPN